MEKSQNNKIEELEKNSKQLLEQAEEFYKQIGKKYYELHSTDAEECIRDEVEKLNEINIQLKYISEQIEAYINGHICTAWNTKFQIIITMLHQKFCLMTIVYILCMMEHSIGACIRI